MADDVRQKIVDAVKSRLQTITTGNGYETNVGGNVKVWRDMSSSPFASGDLDALNIRDMRTEASREGQPMGTTQHEMTMHIEAATKDNTMARDKKLRKILADLIKAIGTDRQWTVSGAKLAWNTQIESTAIDVQHKGEILGGCQLVISILYRTLDFDPYTTSH